MIKTFKVFSKLIKADKRLVCCRNGCLNCVFKDDYFKKIEKNINNKSKKMKNQISN
jgi:hypothetical protein